jgi:hypothetical protein
VSAAGLGAAAARHALLTALSLAALTGTCSISLRAVAAASLHQAARCASSATSYHPPPATPTHTSHPPAGLEHSDEFSLEGYQEALGVPRLTAPPNKHDVLETRWCKPSLSIVDMRVGPSGSDGAAEHFNCFRCGRAGGVCCRAPGSAAAAAARRLPAPPAALRPACSRLAQCMQHTQPAHRLHLLPFPQVRPHPLLRHPQHRRRQDLGPIRPGAGRLAPDSLP